MGPPAPLGVRMDLRNRAAAEQRREARCDRARCVRRGPGRVDREAGEVRPDLTRITRVDLRGERELAALLLRRAGGRIVGDRLTSEGVVAVVAREDLALRVPVEASDREWLQVAVAAVRV